jgi:hypothetical protein
MVPGASSVLYLDDLEKNISAPTLTWQQDAMASPLSLAHLLSGVLDHSRCYRSSVSTICTELF